jgi:hypothetical protein
MGREIESAGKIARVYLDSIGRGTRPSWHQASGLL